MTTHLVSQVLSTIRSREPEGTRTTATRVNRVRASRPPVHQAVLRGSAAAQPSPRVLEPRAGFRPRTRRAPPDASSLSETNADLAWARGSSCAARSGRRAYLPVEPPAGRGIESGHLSTRGSLLVDGDEDESRQRTPSERGAAPPRRLSPSASTPITQGHRRLRQP